MTNRYSNSTTNNISKTLVCSRLIDDITFDYYRYGYRRQKRSEMGVGVGWGGD